jgi:hypothetical protein
LGCHVDGVACPAPDTQHSVSQAAGMVKRGATAMPRILGGRAFKRFVKRFMRQYLTELIFDPNETFDFYDWIESAPYTRQRKNELIKVYEKHKNQKADTKIKAFTKDEDYEDYKIVRGIYSRSDDYKTRIGPFFKKFGDKLFSLKWFIKKVPVSDRPKVLEKLRVYPNIFCTDFSQYEATFVKELMKIEHMVYSFSLQRHPERESIMALLKPLLSTNKIHFKNFSARVSAKRMSGEMNTSCGNGLMNMLITFYLLRRSGNDFDQFDAYFEGDDGIIGCVNVPTAQMYTNLGCNIKIERPVDLSRASFCGNVFVPGVNRNVTNIMEASVRFGWTTQNYLNSGPQLMKQLLKSKSMSMLCEYPGCPILRNLALYGLRVTQDVAVTRDFLIKHAKNTYEIERLQTNSYYDTISDVEIDIKTRILVEEMYGISISKQLHIEQYLDSLTEIQPLKIGLDFPRNWYDFYLRYSVKCDYYSPKLYFDINGVSTEFYMHPNLLVSLQH